jgi:hypothetical protein
VYKFDMMQTIVTARCEQIASRRAVIAEPKLVAFRMRSSSRIRPMSEAAIHLRLWAIDALAA